MTAPAAKKVIPQVALSIALWDPDGMPGSDKLVRLTVERSTGAEGFADMEANTLRLAEELIRRAFATAREKVALMGQLRDPMAAPVEPAPDAGTGADGDRCIPRGSRWRERDTNRVVVILGPGPNSPWMRYEDDPPEKMFHCCIEDFFIWQRFERLS